MYHFTQCICVLIHRDIKNNTDTFYIVNDKNEEYLFNLNDYFADLLLDSEEEMYFFFELDPFSSLTKPIF